MRRSSTGIPCALLFSLCMLSEPLSARENYALDDHWYLLGDFVYMRRQEIADRSLVKDSNKFQCPNQCPNFTVISTKQLVNRLGFEPGFRLGATYMENPKMSFEGNFLYLNEWTSEKEVHGNQSLYVFSNADFDYDF
ncbi:MAG TPA: hypothetical protein VI522_04645, partial [Gammaproteobacteria bacterium]|nr:hypothetical protein [Gammaproteobacteria bacterium]